MRILAVGVLALFVHFLSACGVPEAAAPGATPAAGSTPSAQPGSIPGERRITGIIDFFDSGTGDVITAPDRVRAGEEFQVTITTFGGGCERAGGADVSMAANTATVSVYDYSTAGPDVACTQELKRMPRSVTLRFATAGEALIRVQGVRVGQATPPAGIPAVLERRLTVE